MSEFDFNAYLDRRYGAAGTDKAAALRTASAEKVASLEQNLLSRQVKPVQPTAWADQLGLTSGDFFANRINDAASLVSGASRVVGQVASLPFSAASVMNTTGVSEEAYAAVNKRKQGIPLTPQEATLLATPSDRNGEIRSLQQRFDTAEQQRSTAGKISNFFDLGGIVQQGNRQDLNSALGADFQQSWDQVTGGWDDAKKGEFLKGSGGAIKGLAGLLANAGEAVVTNPSAVREYIIENAPQILIGAVGKAGQVALGASNIGYAADNYRQGLVEYAKNNNGALPPEDERNRMAVLASTLALAEHASSLGQLNAMGLIGKGAKTAEDAAKAATIAARSGFKNKLLNTGKATVIGAAEEAPTEGYQTWAEGEVTGKPVSALDIYKGAVIGGASGGGLSGGIRGLSEFTSPSLPSENKSKTAPVRTPAQQAELDKAIASGDLSSLTNPASATYDPSAALSALSTQGLADTATVETRKTNLIAATKILSDLDSQVTQMQDDMVAATPEDLVALKDGIAGVKAKVASEPDNPKWPALLTELESLLDKGTSKDLQNQQAALSAMERKLETVRNQHTDLVDGLQGVAPAVTPDAVPPVAADAVVPAVTPSVAPVVTPEARKAATASAVRSLNLSMVSQASLSDADAKLLEADTTIDLSPAQRTYLRQLTEARVAENALKSPEGVQDEIVTGGKGYIGIAAYQKSIGVALSAGNQRSADTALAGLTKFEADHKEKAKQATAMLAQFKIDRVPTQLIKTDAGWIKNEETPLIGAALRVNGGLNISGESNALVSRIAAEANLLALETAKQTTAYGLSFGTTKAAPKLSIAETVKQKIAEAAKPDKADWMLTDAEVEQAALAKPVAAKPKQAPAKVVKAVAPVQTKASEANLDDVNALLDEAAQQDSSFEPSAVKQASPVAPSPVTPATAPAPVEQATEQKIKPSAAQEEINLAYKAQRKVARQSMSLWSAIKHSLNESDLTDTYGSEWKKRYTMLRGKPGVSLLDKIADGTLDDFLPYKMRFGTGLEQDLEMEQEAAEYIKEKLRNRDYLTEEAKLLMAQIGLTIEQLENALTNEDLENEIKRVEADIDEAAGNTGETAATTAEDTAGNPVSTQTAQGGTEELTQALVDDVAVDTTGTESILSVFAQKIKVVAGQSMNDLFALPALNLVAQFFQQKKTSEMFRTTRPLTTVKDFLSKWQSKEVKPEDFLDMKDVKELTQEQRGALNNLKSKLVEWSPFLQSNFVKYPIRAGQQAFAQQDMMRYLVEGEGSNAKSEENIATAMAYAAYHFVLGKANSPALLTKESINKMHGRQKENSITPAGMKVLQKFSGFEDTIINDLGEVAIQALGLESSPDAPVDLMPRLRNALGTHVLLLLENKKLVIRSSLDPDVVNDYLSNTEGAAVAADPEEDGSGKRVKKEKLGTKLSYVTFVRDAKGKLSGDAKAIRDANVRTAGVVDKVFGIEMAPRFAQTTPSKFTQKFAKGTRQLISKLQRKVIQATMDVPHTVIPEMYGLSENSALGREAILKIAGWIDLDPATTRVHIANRDAVAAQNQNLENQYDLMMEMLEGSDAIDVTKQAFFVGGSVWKNFRAGFVNQSLNLQTSKIHRFMFGRPAWTTTLTLDGSEADQKLLDVFHIVLAAAFGIKTDKQSNKESRVLFDKALASDAALQQALAAMQKSIKGGDSNSLSVVEREAIQEYARKTEGMMTLQALMAYAKYLNAVEAGSKTVDIALLAGADGKTNGPIFSHFALGAAVNAKALLQVLNRGGMYGMQDKADHYSAWYSEEAAEGQNKNQDLYEDLSSYILRDIENGAVTKGDIKQAFALANAMPNGPEKKKAYAISFSKYTAEDVQALEVITKQLMVNGAVTGAGRNLVKTPLTAFAFGSAMIGSIKNMEDKFIEGIYEAIEGLADGSRKDLKESALLAAVNLLIKKGHSKDNKPGAFYAPAGQSLLDTTLSASQEKAIRAAFQTIMGKQVGKTMTSYFGIFIARRAALNATIQAAYVVYNSAYADARVNEMNRLMDAGEIAYRTQQFTGDKIPLHDMTVKQENALKDSLKELAPVMHTDYSLNDGKERGGMLYMAKSEKDTSQSPLYQNKVRVRKPFKDSSGKTDATSLLSSSTVRIEVDPGVAGNSYGIHAMDSAGMHKGMVVVPQSLNVHDEIGNGVGQIEAAAQAINEATVDTFLNYSPVREAANMLEKLVNNMAKQVREKKVSTAAVKNMFEVWSGILERVNPDSGDAVSDALQNMVSLAMDNALKADTLRLRVVNQLKVMDQYTWEGGQFVVSQAVRNKAAELLKSLPEKDALSVELTTAIKELTALYKEDTTEASKYPDWANVSSLVDTSVDPMPKEVAATAETPTTWGTLGKSNIAHDIQLVKELEKNPNMTGERLAHVLGMTLFADKAGLYKKNGSYYKAFLKELRNSLPAGLKVQYVTPATAPSEVLEAAQAPNSRGWMFSPSPDVNVIYILSPDFQASGVTADLLLHELTHAALARIIQAEEQVKPGKDKPAGYTDIGANPLVRSLSDLRVKAAAYVVENGLQERFGAAVNNLQEFVAYGMTDVDFQEMVLKKIDKQKVPASEWIKKGRNFVSTLVGILFKNSNLRDQDILTTGLTVMVSNVSGLLQVTQKQQADRQKASVVEASLNLSMVNPAATVGAYTTQEVFDAIAPQDLSPVSPAFATQLKGLLVGIVTQLHGSNGLFKEAMKKAMAATPEEVFLKAQQTGEAPFATSAIASGFRIGSQELFVLEQVEATIRAAIEGDTGSSTFSPYKALAALYKEAYRTMTPESFHEGVWSAATALEKKQAEALHAFVFKMQSNGNKTDHLSRFAAMALTHERFNTMLKGTELNALVKAKPAKDASIAEKLQRFFEDVMSWWGNKRTNLRPGQTADGKVKALVEQLATLEANRRQEVITRQEPSMLDPIKEKTDAWAKAALDKMVETTKKPFFTEATNGLVRFAGSGFRTIAQGRASMLLEAMNKLRDAEFKGVQGVVAGTINNLKGPLDSLNVMLRARKHMDQNRINATTATSKLVLEGFVNAGKGMKESVKTAMTAVMLRSGAHVLLDHFDPDQMLSLLKDKAERTKAIQTWEGKLSVYGTHALEYGNQSRALGYGLAVGGDQGVNMLRNAHSIAHFHGSTTNTKLTETEMAKAAAIIDVLSSLYAVQYSSDANIKATADAMTLENARPTEEGNGVINMLYQHRMMEQVARDTLFRGSEALMSKGYLPQITNPYTEVRSATEAEGKDLVDRGYVKAYDLPKDRMDPDLDSRSLYVLRDGGMARRLTGLLTFTGKEAKGNPLHNGNMNPYSVEGQLNVVEMLKIKAAKQAGMRDMQTKYYDPLLDEDVHMSPVLNPLGEAVNYRYTMSHATLDTLMERENRFDVLMGSLAGSIYDKQTALDQNTKAFKLLHELYVKDYNNNPDAYLKIGPDSTNPEMSEFYRLLPKESRDAIKAIWGRDSMMVRNDQLDIVFGYRMPSAASLWDKKESGNKLSAAQQAFTWSVEWVLETHARVNLNKTPAEAERYAKRAQMIVRKGERLWQDVVAEAKDVIVMKIISTGANNILSNMTLLHLNGVGIKEMLRDIPEGTAAARSWRKDSAELLAIKAELAAGYSTQSTNALTRRIAELENALERNPARVLIEAGLMPSIVEDLGQEDSPYSYKTKLERKVNAVTETWNPAVLKVAKAAYMSKDGAIYQTLNEVNQLSDFVSRYALYKHLISRKDNPLSQKEALQDADDSFINYDIPMNRKLQYLDNMGLMMFTKYLFNIQRVLIKVVKDHPYQVLGSLVLHQFMGTMPAVLDASLLSRFGNNPLALAFLQYFTAVPQIATLAPLMGAIK